MPSLVRNCFDNNVTLLPVSLNAVHSWVVNKYRNDITIFIICDPAFCIVIFHLRLGLPGWLGFLESLLRCIKSPQLKQPIYV